MKSLVRKETEDFRVRHPGGEPADDVSDVAQRDFQPVSIGLKDLDRTQPPFAATREISIEGCEGASIAGR